MKKSVAVLLTGLVVGLGFVNASNADDRAWAWSPVGIGLAAPIQLPYMTTDVYGLRLGGFFGANNDVYGLDLGVAEYSAGDFAEKMKLPYADYRAELKRWYNGYRFAKFDATTVYNPVSIALTLATPKSSFRAFWAATGRASPSSTPMSR